MPIDDGVVIAEKVGGQRPIRALDAHVIEQIAVLAGGEGTVGKGDPDLFPLAVLLEMIFQGQEMGGRGVGVPWEKVEPVTKIMEALLSFLRIFGKPEGIDELLVFRAGSSKGFEAIEASGRVNDLSTHDHRGVLAIVTGVGNGHMPVHGGEGILVNLQKTSDIGQDLTFLRVIEPLGVLDLLPSEFGDGHSVVDVILVIDRRIAGISAGGILIGVLLRNARKIDGIAQILGRELLPALGGSDGGSGFVRRWGSRLGGTAGGQTCRESHRCYDSGNPPERPFHIKPIFLSCRFLIFHCNTF